MKFFIEVADHVIKGDGVSGVPISQINIVSVPVGAYLDKEMAAKLREPLQIEHEDEHEPEHVPEQQIDDRLEPETDARREPAPDVETGKQLIRSLSLARRRQG